MCRRVECSKCGRPTYAGCGMHVEQVLGNVPRARRCSCREERAKKPAGEGAAGSQSWLRRFFGE
jgi:hypothetical protein